MFDKDKCATYVMEMFRIADEEGEAIDCDCDAIKNLVLGGSCSNISCGECTEKVRNWFARKEGEPMPKAAGKNKAHYAALFFENVATLAGKSNGDLVCKFLKEHVLGQKTCNGVSCFECKQRAKKWFDSLDDEEPQKPQESGEEWAEEELKYTKYRTRLDLFKEAYPNARMRENGIPTACVRDVFGEKAQPTCTWLTCSECWRSMDVRDN